MDIKQLKYLIALDQTKHFGQAATLCHITQPTLSMRIRRLEEELDLELISRSQRFEGFTEAGERILAWAKTVLAAHDGLQAEAANCRGQLVGSLRVGMVPLASQNPMQLIKPLAEKFPELRFQILSMTSEQIIDQLNRNQLDLGILYDSRFFDFAESEVLWESLNSIPLGLLSKGMHYRHSIDLSFGSKGLVPQTLIESNSTFHLIQAVTSGLCCAVMPLNSGLEELNEQLRIVPIEKAVVHSPLGLLKRKQEPYSALTDQCFAEAKHLFNQ
ncbi:LysR family transcriptional regulator [Vibrio splendidus]|uniref:LysR family transcriptional regulator n=1 Tax=Vibrio splendidus TaxID=29497 RepID=UPI000C81C5F6|nr:LysR family transcriptional regulator [Vibrio splendidus]PMI77181.1 LysR family transcriptional regulator [Vibrio splendidus]